MTIEQYPLIPENEENGGLDRVVVPSPDFEFGSNRDLVRQNANRFTTVVAGVLAAIGAADNTMAQSPAGPKIADVAMAPSGISMQGLHEDPQLKIDECKVRIRNKYKLDFNRTETTKGMAQIMQARNLLPKLVSEIPKAVDVFERKAIHDLVFETATLAGKYKEALFSNMVLTPESDQFTAAYFEKEVDILQSARANEANANAKLVQIEIQNELNERKVIKDSLKILQMNPADAEHNQKVGEYIFFEEGSAKGLFFLANGTNPLHRTLAAKMNDAVAWWDAFSIEMNPKFKPRIREFALQIYLKNPASYTPEQQSVFEAGLKASPTIMKAAQMRLPLVLAATAMATPEIKQASANPQASVENKNASWINGLQVIPKISSGNIVPNGRGGILLKGKDVASGTLVLPFEASGEYDILSEFIEGDGTGNIAFIIPVGSNSCMLMKGPDYVGLDMIKGVRAGANPTKKSIVLQKGVSHKLAISVRKGKEDNSANVKVYIDGELCSEYEGDINDYSITKGWDKGRYVFAIGNNQTNVDLITYSINMVSGTIKPRQQ